MSLAVPSSSKFMFRKNSQNLPVLGSLAKRTKIPFGNWTVISTVINGPVPIPRERFPGNKRYFVLLDANGVIIPSSFMSSTTVPNSDYLEVFANGIITVADDNATNPGGIIDSFQNTEVGILNIKDVPVTMSSNYLQNGYKYSFKSK